MTEIHNTPQMERERPQFEEWMIKSTGAPDREFLRRDNDGTYSNDFVAHAWNGWIGRALINDGPSG